MLLTIFNVGCLIYRAPDYRLLLPNAALLFRGVIDSQFCVDVNRIRINAQLLNDAQLVYYFCAYDHFAYKRFSLLLVDAIFFGLLTHHYLQVPPFLLFLLLHWLCVSLTMTAFHLELFMETPIHLFLPAGGVPLPPAEGLPPKCRCGC